ncbi:MAG: hypothetical protein AABY11_02690 [archaeon]
MVFSLSNPLKLTIIVLCFFLALTFVRGFSVSPSVDAIDILGETSTPFALTITNDSNAPQTFYFEAFGPISFELIAQDPFVTIPAHSFQTVTLFIHALPGTLGGESYSATVRVTGAVDTVNVPLRVNVQSAPASDASTSPPLVNDDFISPLAGFLVFPFSFTSVVDAVLLAMVFILVIALIARVKNRVVG